MISQLKQFVPSKVCLQCDGCCRFQLTDSPWRPKVGQGELTDGVDATGYMKTVSVQGHHSCVHFDHKDSTCGVYSKRPFECALYPFIVSGTPQGVKVYMHLACPHIQEKEVSQELQTYINYLKDFFAQPQTKAFLRSNNSLMHDYSEFMTELRFLFNIEV